MDHRWRREEFRLVVAFAIALVVATVPRATGASFGVPPFGDARPGAAATSPRRFDRCGRPRRRDGRNGDGLRASAAVASSPPPPRDGGSDVESSGEVHSGRGRLSDRRRAFVQGALAAVAATSVVLPPAPSLSAPALAAPPSSPSSLSEILDQIREARGQLGAVPDLIDAEKWDSVRAILVKPPLSDCWTKSAKPRALLQQFADAVGDAPNGDELAVLEARDELSTHLRFLDMAVYNNVFNPIKTEGKSGATKELIRSYYEDPIMEYKASAAGLEELIKIGTEAQ